MVSLKLTSLFRSNQDRPIAPIEIQSPKSAAKEDGFYSSNREGVFLDIDTREFPSGRGVLLDISVLSVRLSMNVGVFPFGPQTNSGFVPRWFTWIRCWARGAARGISVDFTFHGSPSVRFARMWEKSCISLDRYELPFRGMMKNLTYPCHAKCPQASGN